MRLFYFTHNFGNRQCHLCKIWANKKFGKLKNCHGHLCKTCANQKTVRFKNRRCHLRNILLKLCKFMQIYGNIFFITPASFCKNYANLCKFMQIYSTPAESSTLEGMQNFNAGQDKRPSYTWIGIAVNGFFERSVAYLYYLRVISEKIRPWG